MKILIIDDDNEMLNLYRSWLKNTNYEPTLVSSGMAGINKLMSVNYDLIICDYRMPLKDGVQVIHAIKNLNIPNVPAIIVISAYLSDEVIVSLNEIYPVICVPKPIDKEQFLNELKKIG